jgi:hypothetical protein
VITLLRDGSTAMCRRAILAGTKVEAAFFFPPFLCSSKEKGVPPRTGATLINQKQIADAGESGRQIASHQPRSANPQLQYLQHLISPFLIPYKTFKSKPRSAVNKIQSASKKKKAQKRHTTRCHRQRPSHDRNIEA